MKLLFAGTPAVAIPSLEALLKSHHQVVAVVTQPPAPAGRSRQLVESPVARFAHEHQLPVYAFENINDEKARTLLAGLEFDAVAVVAFGQLLTQQTLSLAPFGWINLHFSLLPAWRGAAPVQRCVMAGDAITGASTFKLDAGMDTGDILGQLTIEVGADESAGSLLSRLAVAGAPLLVATFDALEAGTAVPAPQPAEGVSYAPKIRPSDANLKWHHPALGIARWIRGCTPEPGAWTTFNGNRIGVGPVRLAADVVDLLPGEVRGTKEAVYVGTGSHALVLGDIKPAGKDWMPATDWIRGVRSTEVRFLYV